MLSLFLLAVFSLAQALPSCLHLRSHCLRNPRCSAYFASFENTCGYSLTRCAATSPSDCVRDLRAIRELLSSSSCVCYRAIGFHEECDFFRQLIWNHPCERLLIDAGNERDLEEKDLGYTVAPGVKRTTRTPAADHVQELVAQLGGELETKSLLERATCNEALDQVCMRHVSCRQLWQLFRSECGVNQDNKCTMRDPEVCWQSFEGLSWSGLGNCRCDSSNSDCHWIRLLTNYNKCIYEISLTRTGSREDEKDRKAELYRRRFETNLGDQRRLEEATRRQQEEEMRRREEEERKKKEEEERRKETERRREEEEKQRKRKEDEERVRKEAERRKQEERRREEEKQRKEEEERQRREEKEKRRQEEMRLRKEEEMRKEEERRQAKEEEEKRRKEESNRVDPWWRKETDERSLTTPKTFVAPRVRVTSSTSIAVVRKPPERSGLRATINERVTSPPWWDKKKEENTYYRPLFEAPTPPPGYYRYTTASTLLDTQLQTTRRPSQIAPTTRRPSLRPAPAPTTPAPIQVQPTKRAKSFSTLSPFDSSSCPEAVGRCEAADECRWHLGELRARCSRSSCRRDDCASALQRFSRYVPIELAETVMFCQCSSGDEDCLRSQELFYPPCLYSSPSSLATCSHTFGRCAADVRCRSLQDQLRSNCPLSGGDCVGRSLANCRRVLLAARGSILEQPCFCPLSDVSCIAKQRMMIPHNPCIEKAMRDLAEPTTTATVVRKEDENRGGSWGEETVPAALSVAVVGGAVKDQRRKEDHRKHHKVATTTTTSTTTTAAPDAGEVKPTKSRHRTTAKPPPATEAPPPWETTTTAAPTTTTTFVTQPPPPAEGCQARDASGRNVFFPLGTVMRRYVDWSSRCSSWCECVKEELLSCERLPCLEDGACEAPLTSIEFGERIFLKGRGACFCESSQFICELPSEMPELYPGLYVAAAYSQPDVDLLRKEVPSAVLERAGFLSSDPGKDIGSRLQVAFERMLPEWIQCRLVLLSELSESGHAFFRVEWWGQDERFNHTRIQWQHGGAEKVCSPSVSRLSDLFANSDSLRYQLVLSTIKQLKVLDYLDGIPSPSSFSFQPLSLVLAALWLLF